MLATFPFSEQLFSDLSVLDPSAGWMSLQQWWWGCLNASMSMMLLMKSCPSCMITVPYQKMHFCLASSIEDFWRSMGDIKQPAHVDMPCFGALSKFCQLLLVLPHTIADPERLFSMIGKIETSQRSNLHASTVCDLLSIKVDNDDKCFNGHKSFTPWLLKQAKSVTMRRLQERDNQKEQ